MFEWIASQWDLVGGKEEGGYQLGLWIGVSCEFSVGLRAGEKQCLERPSQRGYDYPLQQRCVYHYDPMSGKLPGAVNVEFENFSHLDTIFEWSFGWAKI